MLKLENSIRGLSFSRVAFDLTIQVIKLVRVNMNPRILIMLRVRSEDVG